MYCGLETFKVEFLEVSCQSYVYFGSTIPEIWEEKLAQCKNKISK